MAKHWWSDGSGRLELQLTDEEIATGYHTGDCEETGYHTGDCEEGVRALLGRPLIASQLAEWSADDVRANLREYGAWEDSELADDQMNLVRTVWLACGDLHDQLNEGE